MLSDKNYSLKWYGWCTKLLKDQLKLNLTHPALIAVPFTTQMALTEILSSAADIVEWRLDLEMTLPDKIQYRDVLKQLKSHKKVLLTYRSKQEGGEGQQIYEQVVHDILACDVLPDLIDIEVNQGAEVVHQLLALARDRRVMSILSLHNFTQTPDENELVSLIKNMSDYRPDVVKVAMMPKQLADVERLLNVTAKCHKALAQPLITMSMGDLGKKSRIIGYQYGSELTFATTSQTTGSAPGQLTITDLLAQW